MRSVSKHKKRVDILGYQSIEQGLECVYNASISNYGASRKEFATVFKGDQTFFIYYYLFNPSGLLTQLDFLESNKWAGMNARSQINTLSIQ